MSEWLEVFRAGDYPQGSFTPEDVEEIARNYDPSWHEAPVVLGHPRDDAPAYGWVDAVKAENGRLFVRLKELAPEFVQAVREGRFKKVSVALMKTDRGWYLRHLGFLGAEIPAVKGLAPVRLSSSDVFEEYETAFGEPPSLMSLPVADPGEEWDGDEAKRAILERYGPPGLAEYCLYVRERGSENLSDYGFPVVDIIGGKPHIIPKAVSSALGYLNGARGARVRPEVKAEVLPKLKRLQDKIEKETKSKEARMSDNMTAEYNEKMKALEEAMGKSEDLRREFSEALAKKEAELRARFQREREIERFISENGNRVPPAVRPGLAAFMEALPDTETVVFSDGQTEVRKSPFAFFQELVKALPDMSHLFGEMAKGEPPETDEERLIQAYMKEHGCDYRTAVIALAREGKIGG